MGIIVATGLTESDCRQIAEILGRRANEVAHFLGEYRNRPEHFGSVELALSREVDRLRRLSDRLEPEPEDTAP